jgi:excisionase family DNA binding protein
MNTPTAPTLALDPATIEALADALAARVAARLPDRPGEDGWLDSSAAASYLAVPVSTIHKLSAAGEIPCSQDRPGGKLYFRRFELDRWREGGR